MKRTWTIIGVADVPQSFKWYQSLLGLPQVRALCLLWAISGHRTYSITSSVRASSAGEVSPREVDVRAIRPVRYSITPDCK
jgi:hypothetical protein